MGFYKESLDEDDPTITGAGDVQDDEGRVFEEVEPGQIGRLPAGTDEFIPFDPTHPTTQFGDFVKGQLRGAAAGLDVSYNTLGQDLEGVNFSSIRHGTLEERDTWKELQAFLIEHLCVRVYEAWLVMAITSGELPVPMRRLEKFHSVAWRPRGWQWVSPKDEALANKEAVSLGTKSRTQIASEQGMDFEEVVEQLAAEKAALEQAGLSADPSQKPGQGGSNVQEAQED